MSPVSFTTRIIHAVAAVLILLQLKRFHEQDGSLVALGLGVIALALLVTSSGLAHRRVTLAVSFLLAGASFAFHGFLTPGHDPGRMFPWEVMGAMLLVGSIVEFVRYRNEKKTVQVRESARV